MNFHVLRYVRDQLPDTLSATAHHVAVVLATFTDQATGVAHPSVEQLARSTRRHTATVCRAIAELEAAGVLAVVRPDRADWHRRATNRYRFVAVDELITARTRRAVQPVDIEAHSAHPARAQRAPRATLNGETLKMGAHTDERGTFLPGTGWVRQTS